MPLFRAYAEGCDSAVIPLWDAVRKNRETLRIQAEARVSQFYESKMNNQ